MKKYLCFAFAVLLLLCAACSKNEERLVVEAKYNANDVLINHIEYDYDKHGNITAGTTFDSEGIMDYAYTREYNGDRLSRENHFDSNGELNYSFLFEYDEAGNLVKKHHLNENDEEDWIFIYEYKDGKKVKYTTFADGKAVLYAEYEYDEDGNQTKETVYEPDGTLVRYDVFLYENGKNVTTYKYQTGEKPEKTLISEYDEQGRIIKQTTCTEWGPQVIKYTVFTYE